METIQQIIQSVAATHRGTGGAIAVLQDGEVVGQYVWGYADIDRRIKMTDETIMPICSISKQMVCAVRISLEKDSTSAVEGKSFSDKLSEQLQHIAPPSVVRDTGLTVQQLCNMHSGLRDYWAMTVLWGAHPEGRFSIYVDAPQALKRSRSLHFKPGSEFSYCNMNFYILATLLENVTGRPLADLLEERLFRPAGMKTAKLNADTAALPPPCIGYEGSEHKGFVPAVNKIEWAGDAGIAASLADMIAYEKHIDKTQSDSNSWYSTAVKPQTYSDGTTAIYTNGLGHGSVGGVSYVGHGGALRGYRLYRLYAAEQRVSVIVMFNHEADSPGAAETILRRGFGQSEPQKPTVEPAKEWMGTFLDTDTQLALIVKSGGAGHIHITYLGAPEKLVMVDSHNAQSRSMTAKIDGDILTVDRIRDNRKLEAKRIGKTNLKVAESSLIGDYHCADADSIFHCEGQDGILYGSFDGFLGHGPAHLMRHLGDNVWSFVCNRAMDAPAPGNWTMVFHGDEDGKVKGFTIGCWLARKLEYVKTG